MRLYCKRCQIGRFFFAFFLAFFAYFAVKSSLLTAKGAKDFCIIRGFLSKMKIEIGKLKDTRFFLRVRVLRSCSHSELLERISVVQSTETCRLSSDAATFAVFGKAGDQRINGANTSTAIHC